MICKICSLESNLFKKAIIRNKYNVSYFKCGNCGFVQTEEPYWIAEAYQEPINVSDTGILSRNLYSSKVTAVILYFLFDKNADFLDFSGGYGILTRLMRDIGFNFYWDDPYTKNLFARGFEYSNSPGKIELITAFESFEHFIHPTQEIEKMLAISSNILFSTEILPNPEPEDWWYYVLEHGQHISFYSFQTLKFIASKYNLKLYSNENNLHLLTVKKIDLTIFKLLIKTRELGYFFIKHRMKSKTVDDYKAIKQMFFLRL